MSNVYSMQDDVTAPQQEILGTFSFNSPTVISKRTHVHTPELNVKYASSVFVFGEVSAIHRGKQSQPIGLLSTYLEPNPLATIIKHKSVPT